MTKPKIGGVGWVEFVPGDGGDTEISFKTGPCVTCIEPRKTRLLVMIDGSPGICEHCLHVRFESQATARL